MDLFTVKYDSDMLETIEKAKEQYKFNIDEYTKFKKPPTPIQSFYAGKSIFLTGATGFLGICFVEKVLRDCSDIKKLYLLIRPGRSLSIEDKMKKYFSNAAFDRLKKINPNFEDKIVTVKGDLSEKNLGLCTEDRKLLIDNIDIIVHNGATVKFNEAINVALRINVLGTKDMLELALACKHVKAFVYVSTAYSHHYRKHINEEFYEPAADLKVIHEMIAADQEAEHGLSKESAKAYIGKWKNVYAFAKSISEDLVRQYGEKANFPCSVYRPSMVIAAFKEPFIGWTQNKNGPTTALMASALGVIHVAYDKGEPLDIVPVDYSINALIASVFDVARQWEHDRRPRVYNFGSSTSNPIILQKIFNIAETYLPTIGTELAVWHMSTIFTPNKWLFYILHFFVHFIPAVFGDIALLIMWKKPRALNMWITATKNLDWIMYFMTFGWRIQVTEMRRVFDTISEADQKVFDFNIWNLNWKICLCRLAVGLKLFIVKESFDNIDKSRRHIFLLKIIHYIFLSVFYVIVGYYLMKLFSIIN